MYVRDVESRSQRPEKELKAFAKVHETGGTAGQPSPSTPTPSPTTTPPSPAG